MKEGIVFKYSPLSLYQYLIAKVSRSLPKHASTRQSNLEKSQTPAFVEVNNFPKGNFKSSNLPNLSTDPHSVKFYTFPLIPTNILPKAISADTADGVNKVLTIIIYP